MRINEIVDPQVQVRNLKTPMNGDDVWDRNTQHAGSGAYAYGKEIASDPHLYAKHYRRPIRSDGYMAYIDAIKPYMGSNPYFPRIFRITNITDPTGQVKPRYDMEKLEHGHYLPLEELVHLYSFSFPEVELVPDMNHRHMIYPDQADPVSGTPVRVPRLVTGYGDGRPGETMPLSWRNLCKTVELAITHPHLVAKIIDWSSVNEHLVHAGDVIRRVATGIGSYDLHDDNFMVRRTPVGVQLVITDPLG